MCMLGCLGRLWGVVGKVDLTWERERERMGDFTWFHLLLLTHAVPLLPGGVISGECPET